MQNVSNEWKEIIVNSKSRKYRAYIDLDGTIISDMTDLSSVSTKESIYNDNIVGTFISNTANIEVINRNNMYDFNNKTIKIYIGLLISAGNIEYIPYGEYKVKSPKKQEAGIKQTLECIDRAVDFEVDLDLSGLIIPCTILELAQFICNKVGMELGSLVFPNSNLIISEEVYLGKTYREAIAMIAGACGCYAKIRRDGKLYIQSPYIKEINYTLTSMQYKDDMKTTNYYDAINSVVLAREPQKDNVFLKDNENVEMPVGKNELFTDFDKWETGTYSNVNGVKQVYPSRIRLIELKKVKPNTTYYCNTFLTNYGYTVRGFDINKTFTRNIGAYGNGNTFTTNANEYYVGVSIYNSNNDSIETFATLTSLFLSGLLKPFICLNSYSDKTYEPFIPNGIHELKIVNNYLIDNQRDVAIVEIYNSLLGFNYQGLEGTIFGDASLEVGDNIYFKKITTEQVRTVMTTISTTYNGSFIQKIASECMSKTEIDYTKGQTLGERVTNTEIITDKINNKITEIIEEQTEQSDSITKIELDLSGINSTVESHSETIENIVNEVSDQNSYLPAVFIPFATPVTFNNIVNGSFNVNTFTKGATNAWDAGFTTVETFENGSYVEFKVTELTAAYMIGFNNGTNDANYTSIDCCAYKTASTLYAYTNGSNKGKIATVAVNDLIRVVISNGFYSIYVNDKVVFTSYVQAVLPAYVDASITTASASISNVVCGVFTPPSLRAQSEASVIAAGYANLNALTAQSTADSAITNAGVANELARAMAYGKMLLLDPTFKTGNNNMSTYNNSANTNVIRTWIDKPTDCPTTSAKAIQIQTIGTASPGWGGFYLGTMSRANGIFITRIIAKIPVGYSIVYANNAIGTGGAIKWLTSVVGTGNYQEYILKTTCGSTGTFSSFNFFYLTGSPTPTPAAPLNWFVGYCTCFDLTDNDYSVVTINNTLSDIASDSKLTPDEKQLLKKEWDVIVSEVVLNDAQATSFELLAEKASYDSTYSTLNTYITPLLSDLTVTTDIIGTTLRTNFKTYYDARTNLLNAIATKAKLLADTAQTTANNAQSTVDNLGNSVNEQFLNINNRSAVIEQTLNGVNTKVQEYNETLNTHTGEIVSLKDKSEELEVAVSGITNTLRETGGLNLWKDAVFLFGGENWNGTSFVSAKNTDIIDNTKSGNAIYVQNRTWTQTIQAKNGTYTNSYLFKKLIALAVVTVTINGVTKTLTGTDWTAEIFTFNVTNRSITITITSDTANSAYISDLMLNSGSSVQVWGLNQNETFTDTVQIGKGIKITASGTDTELNATSDAIRIKKKSTGTTITDFTDKGLSTKDMTSDTATIGKLLIQNINGQVCFNNIGGA